MTTEIIGGFIAFVLIVLLCMMGFAMKTDYDQRQQRLNDDHALNQAIIKSYDRKCQ